MIGSVSPKLVEVRMVVSTRYDNSVAKVSKIVLHLQRNFANPFGKIKK